MPQLKKVVLATGNRLIYADTYEQALAQLAGSQPAPATEQVSQPAASPARAAVAASASPALDPRLEAVRLHFRRYRELAAQGKWAEAGRELEAIESAVK